MAETTDPKFRQPRLCVGWRRRLVGIGLGLACLSASAENWPGWRGIGDGVVRGKPLPRRWDLHHNRAWRIPLYRPSSGSPVVWKDRVYLAQPEEFSASVVCLSRIDGSQVWRRDVSRIEPSFSRSPSARLTRPSRCDATPVMDGQRLVVLMGSVVWCLDPGGKELWQREVANRDTAGAPTASPVLWNGLCLLVLQDPVRLEALDLSTGHTRWSLALEKWPTFGPVLSAGELLVSASGGFSAVRADSGEVAWTLDGFLASIRAEPTVVPGLALVPGTAGGFTALDLPRKGRPSIRWKNSAVGRVAGPGVVEGDRIFVINEACEVACLDRRNGRVLGRRALPGAGAVSGNRIAPILSDGLLYLSDGSGAVTLLVARPSLELVAINSVGEPLSASPAAAHGDLILRTETALWCLREGAIPAD